MRTVCILCLFFQGFLLGSLYSGASSLEKVKFSAEQNPASNEIRDVSPAEGTTASFLAEYGVASHDKDRSIPMHAVSPMGLFSQILIVLLLLFAGGFALVRWAKRKGIVRGQNENKLQICEIKSLGNRQFLLVVEYESQKILLGVSPQQIQQLAYLSSAFSKIEEGYEGPEENI